MLEKTLLIIGVLAVAMALFAIRIIMVKGGEFHGTCATNNPMLKNKVGDCAVCGAKDEANCRERA